MGRLSLARETGRVRVDAAQFAPKLLRAGSWNSEPLTFILSPGFEGRGGPPTASTDVQRSTGLNLLTHKHYALSCLIQTLLPLHFSFCRTTLKNEASGNEARGSVLFAFRIVTVDSRSTWIGLRPSSVRNTG